MEKRNDDRTIKTFRPGEVGPRIRGTSPRDADRTRTLRTAGSEASQPLGKDLAQVRSDRQWTHDGPLGVVRESPQGEVQLGLAVHGRPAMTLVDPNLTKPDRTAAERQRRYRARKRALTTVTASRVTAHEAPIEARVTVMPPRRHDVSWSAMALVVIAAGIAALALVINAQAGWRYGMTPLAAVTFAGWRSLRICWRSCCRPPRSRYGTQDVEGCRRSRGQRGWWLHHWQPWHRSASWSSTPGHRRCSWCRSRDVDHTGGSALNRYQHGAAHPHHGDQATGGGVSEARPTLPRP